MNVAKLRQALTDLSTWLTVIQEVNAERKNPSEAIKLACGSAVLAKGRCHAAIADESGGIMRHQFKPDEHYWMLALNRDQLKYLSKMVYADMAIGPGSDNRISRTRLHDTLIAGIEGIDAKESE